MTVSDFLSGIKILEEVTSPINGKIQVVRSLGLGNYIQVEGLTQSGGVVNEVWKTTLWKLKNKRTKELKNCLILGLGGGSAAKLVRKFWPASPNRGEPDAKITGVEIDPIMVNLGKKYLKMDAVGVDVIIDDAYKFVANSSKLRAQSYDLILVDLYIGYDVPEKFQSENYIHLVRSLLVRSGTAVFNRLYFGEKRKEAEKFGEKLEKVFSKVERIFPEANVMFVCES